MKISNSNRIAFLLLSVLMLLSCQSQVEIAEVKTEELETEEVTSYNETSPFDIYNVVIQQIDSLQFHEHKNKSQFQNKTLRKITDIKEAKKVLKGVVDFSENATGEYTEILKINFRNGKKYQLENEYDGFGFIAYFPDEDILLCEGGHSSDVSFNLKNGEETEITGNPDYFVFTNDGTFRLNGVFGGQECYDYFIQQNKNGTYTKIIDLDHEFRSWKNHWLCVIVEAFWSKNNTLFIAEQDYTQSGELFRNFYQVTFSKK